MREELLEIQKEIRRSRQVISALEGRGFCIEMTANEENDESRERECAVEKAEKAGLISSQPKTIPATRNDTRLKSNLKGNGDFSPEVSMKATFEACSSHRRCWRRAQREALVRMGLAVQHVRGIL